MVNCTWFTTFPIFCHQSISFLEKFQKFSFLGWGVTSANFLSFPTFSNHFTPMRLKMTHNGKFGQKSGLDWVKTAIFAYFSIFSPKMRLRLLRMVNFTWFTTFPIFCHQSISFLEKSQNFHFWGGGYIGKFFEFSNFFKWFHTNVAGNDPQWQIWPKKWLRLGPNGHFCIFFYLFPQNEAEIDSEWSISSDSQLSPSFATKASHFWRNLKIFISGGGTLANFLSFPTFSNGFTPMLLGMTHNGKFGQKSGLDWVKTAIFAYFSIFSPKWGWDWLRIVNFTWFTTFPIFTTKASHFWRNLKNSHFWGGYISNFFEFPSFQIFSHQCGWEWPTMANLAQKVA